MRLLPALSMIGRNITRSRRHIFFCSVGLIAGTATLTFFLALSLGIRERVLNRLYPVNQVELQVEMIRVFGLGSLVPGQLNDATIAALRDLPGVRAVYPKQRSSFPARLWGGKNILGEEARLEAFFDGLPPEVILEELAHNEMGVLGNESLGIACTRDKDCGLARVCKEGQCHRMVWWNQFWDYGQTMPCSSDENCPKGFMCSQKTCQAACGSSPCRRSCNLDSDCLPGEICHQGSQTCKRLACSLDHPRVQFLDDPSRLAGKLLEDSSKACPKGTYCAPPNIQAKLGVCEAPIPVLVSPFILEVYNAAAATALGMQRISGMEVLLGTNFSMLFGESYFGADEKLENRIIKRCKAVGFTNKAMEFGVTVPLPYVTRANALFKGREESAQFHSVIVETWRNEDIVSVIEDAHVLGLSLAPRSEEGRKIAQLLMVLTLVFIMVSLIILLISAVNIMHTFLMLVSQRREEIAVYRAIGARLSDIQALTLGEAAILGLMGGVAGTALSFLAASLVNTLAHTFIERYSVDLFIFSFWIWCTGMGSGLLFSMLGAWLPARTAAKTDPARVLSQP